MEDAIQNLLYTLVKLQDLHIPEDRLDEIVSIIQEANDAIDSFIFDLEN
jgi:hypothetical protein